MSNDEKKHVPGLIFKNQPSYTHFNKSFDDPADALFQQLNDVHPIFWKPEHQQNNFEYRVLLDPRNKKEVTKILYDHTVAEKPHMEIIRNERYSKLSKADQLACIRCLIAWQEMAEVNEQDVVRWRSRQHARGEEKVEFDKVVKEYEQHKKASIYAPTERLVRMYKAYYAKKLTQLLKEYPETLALNTHAGLPLPQSRKLGLSKAVRVENVKLIKRQGWVPVLREYANDLVRLNARLESYMDYYVNSIEMEQDPEWDVQPESEQTRHHYYLSLEALLFLLTAGNAPGLPTEVALEIEEDEDSGFKAIKFKQPLPPRNCGWHTHKFVVDKAFEALMSVSDDIQWLHVENEGVQLKVRGSVAEIDGALRSANDFQACEFKKYLQKCAKRKENHIKSNAAIVAWNLIGDNDDRSKTELQLFTHLKIAPAKDVRGTELLSSYALKLEYKPQFGAELMTKYELLEAWFRLKLMSQCEGFSAKATCLRIALNNLRVQLEHQLPLGSIEQQLHDHYQIQIPQLLAGLADTLGLLSNMPAGKYFLRYSRKYHDKLLLAKHSNEVTTNTVFLHTLLNAEPTDLLFMTNVPHLPINDTLCTVIHKRYNIMPCAFKAILNHQQIPKKSAKRIRSDEELLQTRLKGKLVLKQKKDADLKRLQRARRRKIKADKLKREKKQAQAESAKSEELERLINDC